MKGALRISKKSQGGITPLTPNPHASIFAGAPRYAWGDLGEKNDWKMGGGGQKMLLKTNIHPCYMKNYKLGS